MNNKKKKCFIFHDRIPCLDNVLKQPKMPVKISFRELAMCTSSSKNEVDEHQKQGFLCGIAERITLSSLPGAKFVNFQVQSKGILSLQSCA